MTTLEQAIEKKWEKELEKKLKERKRIEEMSLLELTEEWRKREERYESNISSTEE